jgi:hypothetical protein
MKLIEKYNPNQMVPVESQENKKVRLRFSDGSIREVPEFIIVGVLKEGMDMAYCLWRHTQNIFYINWIRRNKINSQWFQYVESLEDDELKDAMKICVQERVIQAKKEDMIWTPDNDFEMDPTTISYDIHPQMYNEAHKDLKNFRYFRQGKPVHGWDLK